MTNKKEKNNELMIYDKQSLQAVDQIRKAITKKHKSVSNQTTPNPYVKKKMGLDYVEYGYMRDVVDKEYPGWSWKIIKTETLGSEAFMVHGRLKWYDEGIWREGDMTAAHRIQKKRGTNEFVDVGNDVKAANTDCIKKAFNMYLNICDDVYKNQVEDFELSDEQKDEIIEVAAKVDSDRHSEIAELVNDQVIHIGNYKSSLAKLKREAGL
ncbi:MAG: hypothetical protein CME31_07290 [Gimesia sp.]|jgi:hypothetical protein|nr:hypothetical protein [Gimesia sp.]|tara:strand:+ start:850 stop:1479 length:630 start_codon:yes stop_codon:yes gene_type:complete